VDWTIRFTGRIDIDDLPLLGITHTYVGTARLIVQMDAGDPDC